MKRIEIPDLFYILRNYAEKIDKEIILKHASSIFLCPNNKGQFNQLLFSMYQAETLDIDELLKVCKSDITDLWRDISATITSFDSPQEKDNNTSVEEIKLLNNLTSNLLSIGQVLILP